MCLGREKVSNILFSVYLLPSYIFSFLMFFLETMWVRVVVLRTEVFKMTPPGEECLKGYRGHVAQAPRSEIAMPDHSRIAHSSS